MSNVLRLQALRPQTTNRQPVISSSYSFICCN
ncbi:class III lanthipeptide [Dactylosporangium aurantiacum]|uniref:Class III lanthipeptide n=1 Tax=Dactylosporangium aurantiacum TaxID=35754 RepID=A0A9Q9IGV9_9ACTN|nr:class III lanthipeptide [Dactylosporangium aurantiacum]MDG6101866.1 class III lanthipeptide [Dactylosporangium aurantiacum]UWZ52335.1 class III lanthipeptide [Dactylosporangium aurantiacum]